MRNKKISISVVFLIIIFCSTLANAEILNKAQIKWNNVPGALKYKVEVKDNNENIVYSSETTGPFVELQVPYGEYKYRIAIISKFNKVYKWSEWFNLSILPPLEPIITSVSPGSIYKGDKKIKIIVNGNKFYKTAKIFLLNDNVEIPMKNIEYLSDKKISFKISSDEIEVGDYTVVVINPGKMKSKSSVTFQVKKREQTIGIFHHFGIEGAYFTPTLSVDSGYNGFGGIGLFYEFHNPGDRFRSLAALKKAPGLYIGTKFYFFSFAPNMSASNSGLGESYMIQFMLFFGYDFFFDIKNFYPCHISPFIGYKQYLRWHTYEGAQYFGSRQVLPIGIDISFDLPKNFFTGIIIEYNAIFDNSPVNVFGFSIRLGYKI